MVVQVPEEQKKLTEKPKETSHKVSGSPLVAERSRYETEALKLDAITTILRGNPKWKEIIGEKTFSQLSVSDLKLLFTEGFDLQKHFLKSRGNEKLLIDFGKNEALRVPMGTEKSEAVVSGETIGIEYLLRAEVITVMVDGIQYTREENGKFSNPNENPNYASVRSGQEIQVLKSGKKDEKQQKSIQEQLKKDVIGERRIDAQKGIAAQVFNSNKESQNSFKPQSNNDTDVKAFFGFMGALIGHAFGLDEIEAVKTNGSLDVTKIEGAQEKLQEYRKLHEAGKIRFEDVYSSGIQRNPRTGDTWCAKTAREDVARIFGLELPQGNAIDVQNGYRAESKVPIVRNDFNPAPTGANVADVFTISRGKYAKYGHRCLAFLNISDKRWYVLDPYPRIPGRDNEKTRLPVPLEEYEQKVCRDMGRTLQKVAFYQTKQEVV